jgi:hypothetical protein
MAASGKYLLKITRSSSCADFAAPIAVFKSGLPHARTWTSGVRHRRGNRSHLTSTAGRRPGNCFPIARDAGSIRTVHISRTAIIRQIGSSDPGKFWGIPIESGYLFCFRVSNHSRMADNDARLEEVSGYFYFSKAASKCLRPNTGSMPGPSEAEAKGTGSRRKRLRCLPCLCGAPGQFCSDFRSHRADAWQPKKLAISDNIGNYLSQQTAIPSVQIAWCGRRTSADPAGRPARRLSARRSCLSGRRVALLQIGRTSLVTAPTPRDGFDRTSPSTLNRSRS